MDFDLFNILRAFASLVPPMKIPFSSHVSPFAVHSFFLDSILLNPHFQQYPPSKQYQHAFWKWAIRHLEEMAPHEDFEIDPRIYEHYLCLLPSSGLTPGPAQAEMRNQMCPQGLPILKPPSPSYVTHYWRPTSPLGGHDDAQPSSGLVDLGQFETVTLLESRTTIESGTTGMRTWLASFVLSQYLINHPDLVKNKRILELGSGIGFLGVIVARLQQLHASGEFSSALWMTDVNENVLIRCKENVQLPCNLSSTNPNIHYSFLDWADSLDLEKISQLMSFLQDDVDSDLILGADIIFDPTLISPLVGVLKLALQPSVSGSEKSALIAATVRNKDTLAQFLQSLHDQEMHTEELQAESTSFSFMQSIDNEEVKIFKIIL